MDVSTVNALITGGSGLTSAMLGLFVNKKYEKYKVSKQAIQFQTLTEVLIPLFNTLNPINENSWDKQRQTMLKLFNQKQILIPTDIESLIERVLKINGKTEPYEQDRLGELLEITESYIHWYRKKLNYPYNKEKIKSYYTPNTHKLQNLNHWLYGVVFIIWMFCDMYVFGFSIYALISHQPSSISIEPIMICIFGIPYLLFTEL